MRASQVLAMGSGRSSKDGLRLALLRRLLLGVIFVGGCSSTPRPPDPAPTPPRGTPSLANRLRGAHQLGPLYFDPQRADFTAWINHFKDQAYRHWVIPKAAIDGASGYVELEFTIERDGSLSRLEIVQSSRTPDLDNAAASSLRASRLLALPSDFPSPQVVMRASYWYNSAPKR